MHTDRDCKEARRFWAWSSALREAQRLKPDGIATAKVEECLVELDALAHHAHNGVIKARCYALLGLDQAEAEDASA